MSNADEQVVRDYLRAQESLDADAIAGLLAPDAVLEFPYAVPGMAAEVSGGPEALRAHVAQIPSFMRRFTFHDTTIRTLQEPGGFLIETGVRGELQKDGAPVYENRYVIVALVVDGRISRWREYFGATEVGGLLASLAG